MGPIPVFATMLNASLGAGFLTVPWIFVQIGNPLAIAVLVFISFITIAASLMIVEASSRAEFLLRSEERGLPMPRLSMSLAFKRKSLNEIPLLDLQEENSKIKPTLTDKRKFELGELCKIYFGDAGMHLYIICMVIGCYGIFCAYTILFASSFTSDIPIFNLETCDIYQDQEFFSPCRFKYWFWVCFYVALMVVLTVAGLENQQTFQMIFTVTRISILCLIFGTSLYSIISGVPLNSSLQHQDEIPFSWSTLFMCIPMIKFTIGFQNIIPSALQNLKNKKANAALTIVWASVTGGLLVLILGLVTGSALSGYHTPTLSTLAWRGYDAGISPRPYWTYLVEYSIVIFPALNVITSCPPNSIALAENLDAYLRSQFRTSTMKYSLRYLIWIPVLVICLLADNLGKCASATALTAYVTVYISVSLMHLISKEYVPYKSPFEGWHSSSYMAWCIFSFSSLLLIVNTGYLIFT